MYSTIFKPSFACSVGVLTAKAIALHLAFGKKIFPKHFYYSKLCKISQQKNRLHKEVCFSFH